MGKQKGVIESKLKENRVFYPSIDFAQKANIDSDEYERLKKWAESDWEGFWRYFAIKKIDWFKRFDEVLDDSNPPFYKFFIGGKLNVSYNCLDRHIKSWRKNKAAIIWESENGDTRVMTYQELYIEVNKFASVLKTLGVKKGDRVLIYMPMIPEAAVAMLASARIGAIHSVVFGGFSSEALRDRIEDAKPKVVITADGGFRNGKAIPLKSKVDEAMVGLEHKVDYVVVVRHIDRDIHMKPLRDFWYQDLMGDPDYAQIYCQPETMDSEDPLFILYTSGSTGKPKGVVHSTAGYLLWTMLTMKWVFDIKDEDTFWCTADIGWITGHSYGVYGPLAMGATTVMYEGVPTYPTPAKWWELVEKHSINILYTAPTAIRALMRLGNEWVLKHDLSSLRLLGTVGEPINPEAWVWYYQTVGNERAPIVDTWWQTETGGHMITTVPGAQPAKPGSAGMPLPGIFAEVVDMEGNPIRDADKGGLLVITKPWPSMLRTVWGDDNRFIETYWKKFKDKGYYFAGDGARKDSDGYFWIMGRVDDVLNVSGHRIGTMEVESALVSHRYVAEAAVVGRPDEITGEAIVAFVVLKDGVDRTHHDELVRELREHVQKEIGPIAKPQEIIFTDTLPKTRSGKIMRRLLKDIAAGKKINQDISTLEDASVLDKLTELREKLEEEMNKNGDSKK
ncbi:acetate--CoA ligase [Hippea sp. KM1]|uniref:acetate--CoA ligase n=1 Tax=Hippea sp. KM1 TaxID=944481 RepID=UPI00046D003A|nr:acetate--CoA ligase [Hippea sp. KM1]